MVTVDNDREMISLQKSNIPRMYIPSASMGEYDSVSASQASVSNLQDLGTGDKTFPKIRPFWYRHPSLSVV